MPRGRPKGSKNKSSSSRKGMAATPTQLASLAKARKVRAKQLTYFPALPEGGFKALSSASRMAAKASAYAKASKRMLSGANKKMPSIAYGSISTAYPVSYSGKAMRARKPRLPKNASGKLNAAVNQVVSAVKKVKKAATEKQLAALVKARAARASAYRSGGSAFYDAN
jgi:hypothetical protein